MKKSDLFLESESGFMMPFVTDDGSPVQISLGYGRQTHPHTGEVFEHGGIDYVCSHLPLYAVATGTVIGVGNDRTHDHFVVIRHGLFEVKYGHVTNSFVSYGQPVVAGQPVAISGDFLHLGVKVNGEAIDPNELIKILYGNICQLNALGMNSYQPTVEFDIPTRNSYEQYQDDLVHMMLQYLPQFFMEIINGQYRYSRQAVQALCSLFGEVSAGNYLYENVPMYGNPLGLGRRAAPLAGKFQDVIIQEFLSYMATRYNVYLPQFSSSQKKKLDEYAREGGMMVDPLADLTISASSYDVERTASVYSDNTGELWWTKAWFNGQKKGEPAIEISRRLAVAFILDTMDLDSWLSRFWPKQMDAYHRAIEQTRSQLLNGL